MQGILLKLKPELLGICLSSQSQILYSKYSFMVPPGCHKSTIDSREIYLYHEFELIDVVVCSVADHGIFWIKVTVILIDILAPSIAQSSAIIKC